jgi:hypothetical protein
VLLAWAIGFQVGIDGGVQTQYQFNGVCDSSCNPTYNFTAYSIQSLQSGNHTLDLTLLTATGVNVGINNDENYTAFYFDHAVVNETHAFSIQAISSTSTTSTAAAHTPITSTAAPPSSTHSTAQ